MENPTPTVEPEIVTPNRGVATTGTAYPMNQIPTGCVVVRRELVWGIGGVLLGVIGTIWALNSIKGGRH
jgi:hypothetical protein